jgi:hypothetical protein
MSKKNGIVEQVRSAVNAHHEEALRAVDLLEAYLQKCHVPALRKIAETKAKSGKRGKRTGTYRDRVLAAMSDSKWMTVEEIASAASMGNSAVRGVLYAPIRDKLGIKTQRTDRGAEFRRAS